MKNIRCLPIVGAGVLFFALSDTYSQSKALQADTSGVDSIQIYCREIFLKNCSGCHGSKGQGDAGPNLTDKFWLHGGRLQNLNQTIGEGVTGKGMIGWKAVFSAQEIQQICQCVLSLQGTHPPKPKKPEGDLWDDPKARPKEINKSGNDSLR